jgi:hypothetical protein
MDIHAVMHAYAESLPDPVIDFYKARQEYSFQEKLINLEAGLLTCPVHLPEQHYFKYLFLDFAVLSAKAILCELFEPGNPNRFVSGNASDCLVLST